MKLKPNTTMSTIDRELGKADAERLRTSKQRRDYLEKLACMHASRDVYVQISGSDAYADIASRDDEFGYTDRLIINIPAETPPQEVTNYDEEVWDALFQKTELYHELGHILYTDWPSFEDTLFGSGTKFGVEEEYRPVYKDYWNCLEDATIEPMLCQRFNIEDDIAVKNENLLRANQPRGQITFHEAVSMALMDYKHPIGWIGRLLDPADSGFEFITNGDRKLFIEEAAQIIDSYAPEVIAETDPVDRNHLIYEMWEHLRPLFDDARAPGEGQDMELGFPPDGENEGDESEGKDPFPDVEEGDGDGGDANLPKPHAGGTDVDVQRKYGDEVRKQKEAVERDDDLAEGAKQWQRVIDREYDEGTSMRLNIPSDPPDRGSFDDATRTEAERLSKPLARHLEQRLQKERQTQKKKGQRTGKLDTGSVHKTKQGQTKVFKKTVDPDDKDYRCIIVDDRSGSMSMSGMMTEVEKASGALAYALEDIGVEVAQMSLHEGKIWLEKDFSETVQEAKRKMFRGCTGGGTPLSDALALARERLEFEDGNPFVIVLTDGEPDHRERYRDQLHQCNFPVLGIYVDETGNFNESHMNESGYFHKIIYKKYDEALDAAQSLTQQVMF